MTASSVSSRVKPVHSRWGTVSMPQRFWMMPQMLMVPGRFLRTRRVMVPSGSSS